MAPSVITDPEPAKLADPPSEKPANELIIGELVREASRPLLKR